MTTMASNISPDDRCSICGSTRDEHGDRHHEFNLHGTLIPKPAGNPPRKSPPVERGTETSRALATLVEVLIEKNIIDAKDVLRIFQGNG